jgi:predicted enzyme related to lactoylglutathione lyase
MTNTITWFELPVRDMDRAVASYATFLDIPLKRETFGGRPYAVFPGAEEGVGGALAQDDQATPGAGAIVYLNAEGQLDAILARATKAHVKVVLPKTHIGPPGYIALFEDTEGNRVGLISTT